MDECGSTRTTREESESQLVHLVVSNLIIKFYPFHGGEKLNLHHKTLKLTSFHFIQHSTFSA
jgi:hypothetical protein